MTSAPSPHYMHAMAYDSARGVTVLFGGYDGTYDGETWDGTGWECTGWYRLDLRPKDASPSRIDIDPNDPSLWVTVGNPNNPGEWSGESYGGYGPNRICGPPDVIDAKDPLAAFEGRKRGMLYAVDSSSGKKLFERALPSPPVFNGAAAARGRLYVAAEDGSIMCFANG